MASLENLEVRVERLEKSMADTRREAAEAGMLARAADRDVSEIRDKINAHTRTLNALRETQVEHGKRLDKVDDRLDKLDRKVSDGFSMVNVGMAQIVALLRHAEQE